MNNIKKLSLFNDLAMFNKKTLLRQLGGKADTLSTNIKRWLKSERLIKLKNGCYVTKEYYLRTDRKQNYLEWLANKLTEPSYLSLEYVLQKYNLLSEAVYSITSVTPKKTNNFINNFGQFSYTNINERIFTGYKTKQAGEYSIREASLAKALFDYLYFQVKKIKKITPDLWDELRLNIEILTDEDKKEFNEYCINLGSKKMKKIGKII